MFKFIYDYFIKRIQFSTEIERAIQELGTFQWCFNLGEPVKKIDCDYNIVNIRDTKKALRLLSRKRDYKGLTTLEHLFNQADNRMSGYLCDNRRREYDTEYNQVSNKLGKLFDFKKIEDVNNSFNEKFNTNIRLHLNLFVYGYIHDLYFGNNDKLCPTFFLDILDIYRKGHIIVGWEGKFAHFRGLKSDRLIDWSAKISKEEGNLLVW